MHLHAAFCHAARLIQIAESFEKSSGPWIPAAGCLRGFGKPDRFAGLKFVTKIP